MEMTRVASVLRYKPIPKEAVNLAKGGMLKLVVQVLMAPNVYLIFP